MYNKKKAEATIWRTIIIGILIIIVFFAVYIFFSGRWSLLSGKLSSVADAVVFKLEDIDKILKDEELFGSLSKSSQEKVLDEKEEELRVMSCSKDKIEELKNLMKLVDDPKSKIVDKEGRKKSLRKELFECYIKLNDCDNAENYLKGREKDFGSISDVSECYRVNGDLKKAAEIFDVYKGKDETIKETIKRRKKELQPKLSEDDEERLKELRDAYGEAIAVLSNRRRDSLEKSKEILNNRVINKYENEKDYFNKIKIHLLARDLISNSYFLRGIISRDLASRAKCDSMEKGFGELIFDTYHRDSTRKITISQGTQEKIVPLALTRLYDCYTNVERNNEKRIEVINNLASNYGQTVTEKTLRESSPSCEEYNLDSCLNINRRLAESIDYTWVKRELRCWWDAGLWDLDQVGVRGQCKSCSPKMSCGDYTFHESCKIDPCGVGGCSWKWSIFGAGGCS